MIAPPDGVNVRFVYLPGETKKKLGVLGVMLVLGLMWHFFIGPGVDVAFGGLESTSTSS
jgi:hypothetical protein